MQLAVLLRGRLKGMGRETLCDVMASRYITPGGRSQLSNIRFLNAPTDFPEGDYVITLEQCTFSVRRRNFEWLMGNELLAEHKLSAKGSKDELVAS